MAHKIGLSGKTILPNCKQFTMNSLTITSSSIIFFLHLFQHLYLVLYLFFFVKYTHLSLFYLWFSIYYCLACSKIFFSFLFLFYASAHPPPSSTPIFIFFLELAHQDPSSSYKNLLPNVHYYISIHCNINTKEFNFLNFSHFYLLICMQISINFITTHFEKKIYRWLLLTGAWTNGATKRDPIPEYIMMWY